MKIRITNVLQRTLLVSWGALALAGGSALAQANDEVRIVQINGYVDILRSGTTNWTPTTFTNLPLNSFDRIRVGTNSSAGIYIPGQNVVRFEAQSEIEISPSEAAHDEHSLNLIRGVLSFFHRGAPGRIRVLSSGGNAGIKGTEFVMSVLPVNGVEQTMISVIDGEVNFTNADGACQLTNGQQAVAAPGSAPARTTGFIANNLLQWCFYYPGVLDLNDVSSELITADKTPLSAVVSEYRAGDLPGALAKLPAPSAGASDAERILHATLLLNGAQISDAVEELNHVNVSSEKNQRVVSALRMLIAAVRHESYASNFKPELATEFLAASYYAQSQAGPESLDKALRLARQAVEKSPEFGFGWERVAELEFSFGRTERSLAALENAMRFSPRNAEALSLKGFLLAAQNKTSEAIAQFERALAIDSALGNAWLGRGLCQIRQGELKAGQKDLLIAAAMEPQRATLRSYLGKAFADAGDKQHAVHELQLAKQLDPHDPTAWLYSALLNEQNNQVNDAVRDLEKSQELNHNRGVYRSGLLLDQDRAVRSANLARIYAEAGLDDVALREASRAVSADYENFSAHLFLANSYQQLRNSSPFDLRFETPAFSEYLIASLLGPADGRILAQPVSQQEYTRLFDRDSYGFSSSSEYLSRGAFSQYAAQYGNQGNFSYALESQYNWDPGQTPNGSQDSRQFSLKAKQMLTPNDGLFFEVLDFHRDGGDLSQRYDPAQADLGLQIREKQEPNMILGWDHKWSESQHTLVLASRFDDSLSFFDPKGNTYLLAISSDGSQTNFVQTDLTQNFRSRLIVNSFEVQQLMRFSSIRLIAGMRYQDGSYDLFNNQSYFFNNNANLDPAAIDWSTFFFDRGDGNPTVTNQTVRVHSLRLTPYLYQNWHPIESLWLIGGLAYDYQSIPRNALFAPLSSDQQIQRQFSPKAGLIWMPSSRSVVRAAYSQSLGGASLDQSVRLEPTQLAGFVQGYRNLIPDSLAGSIGGARFETADISLEHRFRTGTYAAISAQHLESSADQSVGAYLNSAITASGPAVQLKDELRFEEKSLEASLHQLFGKRFGAGLRYKISDARLENRFPQINASQGVNQSTSSGLLHLVGLNGVFQHPNGFFASAEGQWWSQELHDNLSALPGDSFCQLNLMTGYRSPRRHFELSIGLLNVTDQNYHLSPINLYPDLARQRTFVTRLQINF